MKLFIRESYDNSVGDFTVIQTIYPDDEYMTDDSAEPVDIQEYPVNLDEVVSEFHGPIESALKGWNDETFNAGDDITNTSFGHFVQILVRDELESDFRDFVNQNRDLPNPYRTVKVRINNPQCLPSAEEERRRNGRELGRRVGRMLGLNRR